VTTDKEQRRRAVEEAGCSFIVEASAGTGKTSTLINRILHLILEEGPSGVPVRLSQICAITFTEKAAGEMKIRLRQRLEEFAAPGRRPGGSAESIKAGLAREALRDLESASISTFHAFAVSLLKERPIEAGLDPHFTALDEIRSELLFRETWDAWIGRALTERHPTLERALKSGIGLPVLQDLARTLRLNGNAVRTLQCDSPPEESDVRKRIDDLLQLGLAFTKQVCDSRDRLLAYLEIAIEWLRNPGPECAKPAKPGRAGSATNWAGGKQTLADVQAYVRDVAEFCDACRKLPAQRALHETIGWIRDQFVPEWEGRKRAGGFLDFDDQLWLARDLLIRSKAVRREFQTRFATLLVDEFQDTDPIQWDIVRLLSSADLDESDPARMRPGRGRLFLVGDPKQSIYRFRSADIETYLEIADPEAMQALGLERLQLTTNFRSVPSILRFVDAAFVNLMCLPADGRYQPDYLPFGDQAHRTGELDPPCVHLLGDRKSEAGSNGTVRGYLELEASRIAGLISRMRGSASWKVQDPGEKKGGGWRAPRYGDIAILLPVLSRADILEDALRDLNIPYVLEGGKFYYARSEVSSAITILRAVANPNDGIALYGALRSVFFGFSDEDLLRARVQGQKLDYRVPVPADSPLAHPYEILRDLHRFRHARPASETFEILLQKTAVREVLAVRGFQSLANLGKLARTLRALQGERTFSQVIDLLSTMDEEGLAESESRLMEERSDAVRILSIHKAKGLDFPIVIAAGLGQKRRNRNSSLLADFHREKIFGISIGPKESGLQTPGWKELTEEERKRENAELVRLLYVDLTRARDHMILCTHTQNWKLAEGRWIPDTENTRMKPLSPLIEQCMSQDSGPARWVDLDGFGFSKKPRQPSLLRESHDWQAVLEAQYSALRTIVRDTPSSRDLKPAAQKGGELEQADRPPEERMPDHPGNRAVRLGVAFHEAMERVDLLHPGNSDGVVREMVSKHSLDRDSARKLESMLHETLSCSMLERVRAAANSGGRILREVPFVRPLKGAGIEEGKIDLLFEEEGGWVLVDYKTDWVSDETESAADFFRAKYSGQIREYMEALNSVSAKIIAAFVLLARTGTAVEVS
jgi:ATP-dependent helicase/nuclease subunit A